MSPWGFLLPSLLQVENQRMNFPPLFVSLPLLFHLLSTFNRLVSDFRKTGGKISETLSCSLTGSRGLGGCFFSHPLCYWLTGRRLEPTVVHIHFPHFGTWAVSLEEQTQSPDHVWFPAIPGPGLSGHRMPESVRWLLVTSRPAAMFSRCCGFKSNLWPCCMLSPLCWLFPLIGDSSFFPYASNGAIFDIWDCSEVMDVL